jgi:hypothetical protein
MLRSWIGDLTCELLAVDTGAEFAVISNMPGTRSSPQNSNTPFKLSLPSRTSAS